MFTVVVEILLSLLLMATLGYCIVLERKLADVRKGQEGLATTIGDLNSAIGTASTTLRALQSTAATTGAELDQKVGRARATIDELSLVAASGERIAERMERSVDGQTPSRIVRRAQPNSQLPSGSIMGRLDALRAAR